MVIAADKKLRVNDDIIALELRVIGADGEQIGVIPLAEALEVAENADLDLVEISPNAEPPVARVMDYGKHLYKDSKQKAAARKKQKIIHVKEIKFRPGTDVGDYDIKLRKLKQFLENGDKTKVTLRFRGRELAHKELGADLLKRVEKDLEEYGMVEQYPKFEGRQMVMVLAPKRP